MCVCVWRVVSDSATIRRTKQPPRVHTLEINCFKRVLLRVQISPAPVLALGDINETQQ